MAARKVLLPRFCQTQVTTADTPNALRVDLPPYSAMPCYFSIPVFEEATGRRIDGKPSWKHSQYNLYPVVLNDDGSPWAEVAIYLQSRLHDNVLPNMGTYAGIAMDLAAFRRFLDSSGLDWTHFPSQKPSRVTYRYNGHLLFAVGADDLAPTTAKRRMSSVVSFYRWLIEEGIFVPAHTPWKESDRFVEIKDSRGLKFTKKIKTTDVSINIPSQNDPYAGTIDDGGQLRPLPLEEQDWLIEALTACGNTEMTLIHLFGLLTGARIQTILTFQLQHTMLDIDGITDDHIRFPVGFGTSIDTKGDKQIVLHIPVKFYRALITYANSPRARSRRLRAKGGDNINQYLFLSIRGAPLYRNKRETRTFDSEATIRHEKTGQGIRQFMTDRIIPYIRRHHAANFDYIFHDTRATFGMNLTDIQLQRVARGEISLLEAREHVKMMMGHDSAEVTDRYLQFKGKLKFVRNVEDAHYDHLWTLAERALKGKL